MILGPDSRLRRIPVALDRKTAFFLEGIRVSIEMIDLAHQRLQQALITIATLTETGGSELPQGYFTSVIADAWVIIDCIHRLQGLIQNLPGIPRKMRIPAIRNFLTDAKTANDFRNTVQHLDQTIGHMASVSDWSVWGSLSWAIPYPNRGGIIKTCTFKAGFVEPGEAPLLNPLGQRIRMPVGLITLSQAKLSISLSDFIIDIEELAKELETRFAAAFDADLQLRTTYPSDVTVSVTLAPAEGVE